MLDEWRFPFLIYLPDKNAPTLSRIYYIKKCFLITQVHDKASFSVADSSQHNIVGYKCYWVDIN